MPPFPSHDFLLRSAAARQLYHEHAADLPIYDYHSHLDPAELARDRRFANLTELWLDGDHYKWRAMRTAGVDEKLITGDADPYEKFHAFASIVPQCIGNPIYHWTHMELRRPLGIDGVLLSSDTARQVWDTAAERLAAPGFSARGLLRQFDVRMVATTDDPADSLEHHSAIARDPTMAVAVLPTWRPDILLKPWRDDFPDWLDRLGRAQGTRIASFEALLDVLEQRLEAFAALGCVSADHGFDRFEFSADRGAAAGIFAKRVTGARLTAAECTAWVSELALWLGRRYARRGWVMQLHIGAQRDNNSRMLARLGQNSGFDSIGDAVYAEPLARFLDTLDRDDSLPKTILYGINPRDNEMLATMAGNFQDGRVAGKIQFGSAWWFNDQADGIRRQLTSVAGMSLLGRFVGMLTDSRSLTSFSRHDYFRRILCDLIGSWVEAGEAPADFDLLGDLVRDIGYRNTIRYFGLDATEAPEAPA